MIETTTQTTTELGLPLPVRAPHGESRGTSRTTNALRGESKGTPQTSKEDRGQGLRRIAVVPAYNEEPTVYDVLARLHAHPSVDEIVIVDDGSTDNTRAEIQRFISELGALSCPQPPTSGELPPGPPASTHVHSEDCARRIQLVAFDANRGMSAAYYEAFRAIGARVAAGDLDVDDLILTVDADGQHDPELLDRLIAITVEEDLGALVAERDLKGSGYTRYKRLGNWVMSTWATIWAGQRWRDVESGFRIFKVGPLLDALQYYKGYKYSETVEVAVILSRLGYKVRNDVTVPVPVFRSRTRLYDVAVDLTMMPMAWWRVSAGRRLPKGINRPLAYWLPLLAFAPLVLLFALVGSKTIFLGNDSINNYVHVWYLKDRIVDHATLPVRAAPLEGGDASALPYGGVPWIAAALLSTVLADRAVTLLFVVGLVALLWTAGSARPVMRDPWFLLVYAINPFFIDAMLSFQFSFVWSAVFFFLFVAALDRRRWWRAGVFGWLAAGTHPIMGLPPVALYLAWKIWRRELRASLAAILTAGMGVALVPALYLTLITPAVDETSFRTIVLSVGDVVVRRGTILAAPFVFTVFAEQLRQWWRPVTGTVAAGLVVNVVFANGFLGFAQGGYSGIVRSSHNIYAPYIASGAFDPGARYRVLEPNEREDGSYYLVRHGAVLTSELFTESQFKRSFRPEQYGCFLRAKGIDYVVAEHAYFSQYPTNELRLLNDLAERGLARPVFSDPRGRYQVFDVRPARLEASAAPTRVSACFRRHSSTAEAIGTRQ